MDRDQMSEGSTPSANDDGFPLKRTISTSNSDPRLNTGPTSARADAAPLEHSYLDTDTNDSKRRKIQDLSDTALGQTQTIDASNSVAGIHHGSTAVRSTREYSFSDIQDDPRTATAATTITAITTTTALSIERPSLDAHESESGPRTLEPRRSVKRVNYADPEDSIEEDEDDQIHQEDTLSSRRRTQSRTSLRSRPPPKQNASEDEGDDDEPSDKSGQGKPEQDSAAFGPRTLRDRRSITAPKPFPIGNPNPPASRIRRPDGGRRTGRRHYEESDNIYRSSSRSLAPKRPPPTPRQITENMRITRGMSGSLMDSPNSRDVTPDRPSRQNGRSGSRFHHGISSDEEQDLDEGDGRRDEDEEDDDEEMGEGEADIEVASSLNNQEDNGLIRMTRLRARNQAQPAISSIHSSQRSSRPKSTHSRSQQEADRKYDLRERPKNRPTYIADRPIPSPTRPRTSRMSSYGGRDPFSRPRQNRPSLFDALRRAGVSSSDEHEIPTFKRRSGTAESRGSSSRILPMNMHELADSRRDVIASRVGQLADTDPLAVGNSVDFDKVGGLDHHVKSLKEMVILPLLYPEVYSHFQMMPPRGVLFHGPPGTGKTLLARALASSCSTETQKVAFFMRKGADCLSKWVGEAERQLRLLFEEAKAWQPSIIFFDEIDGLCPVRSSKQEQIHASIVSTMLALMDGLDGRGQVIVIGATNRIDAIDPALRRPGRFDREFYFPLPNEAARRAIIDINTNGWVPALDEGFKNELARITTRYCGADIKALCTEAALKAIRRRYPQIYESNEKLQIDASTIVVEEIDLLKSAKSLTPASYRVTGATASPLPINIAPLLKDQFSNICKAVDGLFSGASKHSSRGNSNDDDDDTAFQAMGYRSFEKLKTFRPRMLIAGERGMGQRYIGPALLHYLEGCTVQQFDLAALMSESSRTPEAACVQFFIEVKRHAPSIIYIPHIDAWWSVVSEAVKATFSNLLDDLSPEDGILFLATSETPLEALPIPIRRWFLSSPKSRIGMSKPSASSRALFFEALLSDLARPPTDFKVRKVEPAQLEQLKKAPPPQPRVPTTEEKKLLREHDEYVLRELRISLRTVVDELFKERKFKPFFRPVEPEEFPDYYDIIKKPMDLTTVSDKINDFMYLDVKEFLSDIDLIADNTRLYNDIHDPSRIIYRARDLQDVAHAMISRLDPELIIETEKTAARRRQEARAHQRPQGERMSRRRLGLEAPAVPDDPEIFLRNRTVLSKLLLDATVREESADISVKVEGGQTVEEDYEQPSNMVEDLDDGSRYHDGEESGTSLSMPPSVAASVAASSIPPTPTVSVTPGPLPASTSLEVGSVNGKMDVDSPRQSQEGPEVAMGNGPDALSSYTEDYVDDGKEAAMSISPAATSLVAAVVAAAASDVTDTKEMADGTLTPLGKDESQPAQEDTLDVQEETKEAEEEEPMEMVLEQHDVAGLQAVLIKDTEGSSVEELDQLRAALYEIIWEHRLEWDKSPMLSDMRESLAFMTVLRMESEQDPDLRPEHHFD
ncbi:ATPase AAA domain-containing protein 2B [Mortierella antarctica]|nr:ATPase AAA domain-containing protein 2B [Mortierella antarctica]